jgi:hypothetical protein
MTHAYLGAAFPAFEERFVRWLNKVMAIECSYLRTTSDVSLAINEAALHADRHRVRAVIRSQLGENAFHVALHRGL